MKTFTHYLFTFSFVAIAFTANSTHLIESEMGISGIYTSLHVFEEKAFLKTDTIDAPVVTSSDGSYVIGCEGDTVTLTASEAPDGYGYQWYKGVGYYQPIAGATEQTLLVTQAYTEDFVVQYTGACPSDFSNVTIVFLQNVPTPTIFETPEGYLEVNGAAGYGYDNPYTWYLDDEIVGLESCPGIGYDQWCVQPIQSGNYVVCTYYPNIGCSACSEPFTFTKTDTINAPVITSSHELGIACEGETLTLTASEAPNGYGYQWYDVLDAPIADSTMQTLSFTETQGPESYYVKYVGEYPSEASNWATVNIQFVPTPVIFETSDGNLEVQGAAANYFDNPYSWFLEGEIVGLESCPGISTDQWCVQPTQSGNYVVCTTYFFDIPCSACSAAFNYISTNTENITGINNIQISPIPANDFLTINLTTNKKMDLQIKLQNVQGQILIEKEETITGNWNTSLTINHLPNGTYFLTLLSDNEIMTKKVLKY